MDASMQPRPPQGSSIVVDEDGAYHWVYEFNLFTNPTILLTVVKIFLGIIVALIVLGIVLTIPDLVQGYASAEDVLGIFVSGGWAALLFIVLTIIGYVIYAFMNGGKYCVVFTMDNEGVTHKQLPKQFEKAQVVAGLNVLAGLATGNLSQMGMGILTATHDTTSSNFASVRSVKGSRALRVIKVNEPMAKKLVLLTKRLGQRHRGHHTNIHVRRHVRRRHVGRHGLGPRHNRSVLEKDGHQYGVGSYILPSGETTTIALVRP